MDLIKQAVIILMLVATSLCADELTTLFENGNQHYQQGNYTQAIEYYEQIISAGYESGEIYFNLGNAYYKISEPGKSRLNYEKAMAFIKGDEALDENLRILRMRLVDQIEPPPVFFLNAWWSYLVDFFSIQILVWIVALLFLLLIGTLIFRIYHTTRGHLLRGKLPLAIVLVIFLIFTLISIQKVYNLETERFAVIMKPSVTLRAEPKSAGTEVFVLHEGTKVKIERETGEWVEIKLIDGKMGWLEKNNLEVI